MTIPLNLKPDVEKGLMTLAQERGVSLSDYLEEMAAKEAARVPVMAGATGEERAKAFLEWADSFPDTPPLSDDDVSRAITFTDRL